MKIQVLIVLVCLLALALIVGFVLGPTLEDQPDRKTAFLEWVRERGGALEKGVHHSDLQVSPDACLENSRTLILLAGQRCRIDVSSAEDNVRSLELELITPGEVDLVLEHRNPEQGLNVDTTLEQDGPLKVQIYERGAKLVLTNCRTSSEQGCQIRFE